MKATDTKTKFLEDPFGNDSNSRLIVDVCIAVALILACIIIYLGRDDVLKAAEAVAIEFGAIAVPCLTFLFGQKKNETNIEINTKKQDTIIEKETIINTPE